MENALVSYSDNEFIGEFLSFNNVHMKKTEEYILKKTEHVFSISVPSQACSISTYN